jgi:hypothetical protein
MATFKIEVTRASQDKQDKFLPLRGLNRSIFFSAAIVIIAIGLYFIPRINENAIAGSQSSNPVADLIEQPGTTVGGYPCGNGLRQIPWSHYSPWCEPTWHGNNGGATSLGVTSTTITITYRAASTADLQLAYGIIPPSIIGTNQAAEDTLQAYINLFNKEYELYGRQVKLVTYNGQSDFIKENIGVDTQAADADAINVASNIKAFADLSLIDSTQVYDGFLAQHHVIGFNLGFLPQSWYQTEAPYSYSPGPDCNKTAVADAAVIGKTMAGLPAIYAGDPLMHTQIAKFGVISPTGEGHECSVETVNLLKSQYGVNPAVVYTYTLNIGTIGSDTATMVAQFKDAGVTTVIALNSDPITPSFVFKAAQADNYYPEWYAEAAGAPSGGIDAFGQNLPAAEVAHSLLVSQQSVPQQNSEAYKAFQMGAKPGYQLEPLYPLIYEQALLLFNGLQAAGPDLTPQTFAAGLDSLPDSTPGGQFGLWSYGPNTYDPQASFQVDYWDPSPISPVDGKPGEWLACNSGEQFVFANNVSNMPDHKQLSCFGQT